MDVIEGMRGGNFREAVTGVQRALEVAFLEMGIVTNLGESAIQRVGDKPSNWITVADDSGISATRFERLVPWRQSASFRFVYS